MNVNTADFGRLEIGSVLRRSISLIIDRFPLYFWIAMVPTLFLAAIAFGTQIFFGAGFSRAPEFDPRLQWDRTNWFPKIVVALPYLMLLVLVLVSNVATVHATSRAILGERMSVWQEYRRVRGKNLRLFLLMFPVALTGPLSFMAGPVVWLVALPAIPVAALENRGIRESLKRSSALMAGYGLRVYITTLIALVVSVLGLVLLLVVWARAFVPTMRSLFPESDSLPALAVLTLCLVLLPVEWLYVFVTLQYERLRVAGARIGHGALPAS